MIINEERRRQIRPSKNRFMYQQERRPLRRSSYHSLVELERVNELRRDEEEELRLGEGVPTDI